MKSAFRYPIMVVVAILGAILIINAFVVPAFMRMFEGFKGGLPLPTRVLMASSHVIMNYWHWIILVSLALIFGIKYYISTTPGRFAWDRFKLRIPFIGWIVHRILLARFARLYSLILRSGITALDGMKMVSQSMGNNYFETRITEIVDMIARGSTITGAITKSGLFSPLVIQMISLGEESGRIDEMLTDVSEFYEREVEYDLARLSDAIEPILLMVMAAMVLVLALGVFLPMWDMVKMVK